MRIVGGRLGGRPLVGPRDSAIRPTSDRVRESLFNIIEHGQSGVAGCRVIDLFAGTGALGLEALSRGAQFALFVEESPSARALIRANVDALHLGGATRIFRRDARKLGLAPPGELFDLAFLDPPYGEGLAEPALCALRDGRWLAPQANIIVEESAGTALALPSGFALDQIRTFGDTSIAMLRLVP